MGTEQFSLRSAECHSQKLKTVEATDRPAPDVPLALFAANMRRPGDNIIFVNFLTGKLLGAVREPNQRDRAEHYIMPSRHAQPAQRNQTHERIN